jgi:hypothetical protein
MARILEYLKSAVHDFALQIWCERWKEVPMPSHPVYTSDLAETDRTHLTNFANQLLSEMKSAEGRLRAGLEGEDPYAGGSVIKLMVIGMTLFHGTTPRRLYRARGALLRSPS